MYGASVNSMINSRLEFCTLFLQLLFGKVAGMLQVMYFLIHFLGTFSTDNQMLFFREVLHTITTIVE